jgi:ferredoxin
MAKIFINNLEFDIPDGHQIADTCEQAGVPFSCHSGACGTCQIEILLGSDNLNELNREENELAMDRNHRLSCQCRIMHGIVKITY